MKKMNIIIGLVCIWMLTSCNSWLDLKPYGEVEQDKMFEEEQGFLQTLSGSYLLLTDPSAYGRELTVGFPDEIVRYWKKRSEFYEFDYTNAAVVGRLDATWLQMYKAIANTNLVLQNLAGKDPADFEYYNLIKGEALGLRAYLHLDLLRLYGPVLTEGGMEQKAIPYHEEFSNQTVKLMTAREVLSRIQRDLDTAYVLLADDPVKIYGRDEAKDLEDYEEVTAPEVKGLAFSYRGCRMNYYAVCATLARVYLLKEDYTNALKYANEILVDGEDLFTLVDRWDMSGSSKDLMFERELIWSLYDQKTEDHLSSVLRKGDFTLDSYFNDYVYTDARSYGSEEDHRWYHWFEYSKTTPAYWYLNKYTRTYSTADQSDQTPWRTVVPMIRLSEVYYMAAEAWLKTNPAEAFRLLNEVRISRNISELPDNLENNAGELFNQLIYEYQKDFWGEGKLFYLYKRLFLDITTQNGAVKASRAIYELPVPKDEIEFGDNNQ